MAEQTRNPKNAAGPFYVVKGQCISCGAPQAEAPGLITLDDDGCYFHKQPETTAEVNDAIRAMFVSCIEAYRYGGDNTNIRRRLAELGHARLCDRPLEQHPVVLRNHARFSLSDGDRAVDVATLLVSAFEGTWKDGKCTGAVVGDSQRAEFEYTHSKKYGTPRRYRVERILTPPAATTSPSIYRHRAAVRAERRVLAQLPCRATTSPNAIHPTRGTKVRVRSSARVRARTRHLRVTGSWASERGRRELRTVEQRSQRDSRRLRARGRSRRPLPSARRAMNPFERAVLRITAESAEAIGWYQIERRLSNIAFEERPYLPHILAELIGRGWISEVRAADEPKIRYVVTKLGEEALGR